MELLEQQNNQEVKQNLCEELKVDMRLVNSFFSLQCNFINLFSQAKYGEEFVPSWFVMSSYKWLGKQYKKSLKQMKKTYKKTLRTESINLRKQKRNNLIEKRKIKKLNRKEKIKCLLKKLFTKKQKKSAFEESNSKKDTPACQ